ncbi:MAG: diguanylate cyclase, partial [Thiotrichales bacterium]|nr:diguanylate cyclase [Thiotrichales bacterium]
LETRAEELRTRIKGLVPEINGTQLPAIAISMGISMLPEHGKNSDQLVKAADSALYQSKQNGRDRYTVALPLKGRRTAKKTVNTTRITRKAS